MSTPEEPMADTFRGYGADPETAARMAVAVTHTVGSLIGGHGYG